MTDQTTTVGEEKTLLVPRIHLNGTSGDDLLKELEAAFAAVDTAVKALMNVTIHGRDFYTQSPTAFGTAREQHIDRLKKLISVKDELLALHGAVLEQVSARAEAKRK